MSIFRAIHEFNKKIHMFIELSFFIHNPDMVRVTIPSATKVCIRIETNLQGQVWN